MPLSTDVTLPDVWPPIFPDRCIVCHRAAPESTAKLASHGGNPLAAFFLPILLLFGWKHVKVPVCAGCTGKFYLQRWGRNLVICCLVFAAICLIAPQFKAMSGGIRRLVVCALVLKAIAPYWLFEAFWPRCIEITASTNAIDYEFANLAYAQEFLDLNRKAVIKSDLPI